MNTHAENVEALHNYPTIAKFAKTHDGAVKELDAAIETLADKNDARAAVLKLLPALKKKKVYVFFSYKTEDEQAAKAVVNILRRYAGNTLEISYQAEFTEEIAGKQWREKIRNEVSRANWFILLLPDRSADDWDWCLYEAGVFDRQPTSADRLICLHHPDAKPPSQISHYQAVATTVPEVEKFLRMVYVLDNPLPGMGPINKSIENDLEKIAREIVDEIREPKIVFHERLEPVVTLKLEDAAGLQSREGLDDAIILKANEEALGLFEFRDKPDRWRDLRSGITDAGGDNRWLEEMFHVIRKIANGRHPTPIQAVFQTKDGKMYRPNAHAIDRIGEKGPIESFDITFVEEVGVVNGTAIPQDISTLATILRMAFRFRWEVLENFANRTLTEDDVERLDHFLTRMEVDAASRGDIDPQAILDLFPPEQAQRIGEMFAYWYKLRNPSDGTGELDVAIEAKDTQAISKVLADMRPLNQEFLEIAADRFSSIVSGQS